MNNDSFRNMVSGSTPGVTPTPGGDYGETPAGPAGPYNDSAAARRIRAKERKEMYKEKGGKKGKGKGGKKSGKGKGGDQEKASEEVDKSGYQDRAAERRAGQGQFERTQEDYQRFQKMSADESQYLGGDLDHTFWVKGLDKQLLHRVKEEQAKHDNKLKEEEKQQKIENSVVKSLHPDQISYRLNLQQMHKRLLRGDLVKSAPQAFLPRRTYYQFSTELMDFTEKPVYGTRSKDECPSVDKSLKCEYTDAKLLKHLTQTMDAIKLERKMKRQGLEPPPRNTGVNLAKISSSSSSSLPQSTGPSSSSSSSSAAVDNIDIFSMTGSLKFEDLLKKNTQEAASRSKDMSKKRAFDAFLADDNDVLSADDFEPSNKWRGPKKNWYFGTGNNGIGYYRDYRGIAKLEKEEKLISRGSKKTNKKRLEQMLKNSSNAYGEDEFAANPTLFRHDKSTMERDRLAEEEFAGMSAKERKRFESKAKRNDHATEAVKHIFDAKDGAGMIGQGGGGKNKKFKSDKDFDNELKKIDKLHTTGKRNRLDEFEEHEGGKKKKKVNTNIFR